MHRMFNQVRHSPNSSSEPEVPPPMDLIQLLSTDPNKFVKEYLRAPLLPVGERVKIDKIACFNFNPSTREPLGHITYKHFRLERPDEFPECEDPDLDYADDDQVSPAMFLSGTKRYRAKMILWFPLSDVLGNTIARQIKMKKKLLPIELLIDDKDQFMNHLFNLGLTAPPEATN